MDLLDELGSALRSHRHTPVKCVLLTGAGDRAFAAGGDLKELDAIRTQIETRVMIMKAMTETSRCFLG